MSKQREDLELQRFYLERLSDELVEMERLILSFAGCSDVSSVTNELKRQVHSIKGAAGSYGFELVSILAHRLEDLIALVGLTEIPNDERIDRLLSLKDTMAQAVNAYGKNDEKTLKKIAAELGLENEGTTQKISANSSGTPHKLLLVDSSEVTLRICIEGLKKYKMQITTETSGYAALGRLLTEKFDSLVITLHAPLISAPDLAFIIRNIKGPNRRIPLTALTSDNNYDKDPRLNLVGDIITKDHNVQESLCNLYAGLTVVDPVKKAEEEKSLEAPIKKIFLIDDSEDIHDLVQLAFQKIPGMEIGGTGVPADAMKLAEAFKPELILLDSQMPGRDGKAVYQDLKASKELNSIPIYFLTGVTQESEIKDLMSTGAVGIFNKPFSPKTFASKLFEEYNKLNAKKKVA